MKALLGALFAVMFALPLAAQEQHEGHDTHGQQQAPAAPNSEHGAAAGHGMECMGMMERMEAMQRRMDAMQERMDKMERDRGRRAR